MFETFEGLLLKSSPDPGFSLTSEQGDNVGEIWNEFPIEVCKPGEQPDPFD